MNRLGFAIGIILMTSSCVNTSTRQDRRKVREPKPQKSADDSQKIPEVLKVTDGKEPLKAAEESYESVWKSCLNAKPTPSAKAGWGPYSVCQVHGYTIHLTQQLMADTVLAAQASRFIYDKLGEINRIVGPSLSAQLTPTHFWVHLARDDGAATFHPSREYLETHGLDPDMAQHVELSNIRHAMAWSAADQPLMLLHELSHAYMYRVVGADDPRIQQAFSAAVKSGKYEKVQRIGSRTGPLERAYALTNKAEYFAELSEAYWGKNDFYPFQRNELADHDPQGFAMIKSVWQQPK